MNKTQCIITIAALSLIFVMFLGVNISIMANDVKEIETELKTVYVTPRAPILLTSTISSELPLAEEEPERESLGKFMVTDTAHVVYAAASGAIPTTRQRQAE